MVPMLAAVGCAFLIAYLFYSDRGEPRISWIPLIWMFFAGSRYASSWLQLSVPRDSPEAYEEGSPLDRAVFLSLILAGAITLVRRKLNWGEVLSRNKAIAFYLLYCLLSVLWSDEPFVLLKRWVKDLGNPIMALVLLTERNPYKAVGMTIRRFAFLVLPLSVLFLRYFPELGRTYHADGSPLYTGVGHQKNDLGLLCLISGIYLVWRIFPRSSETITTRGEVRDLRSYLLLGMMCWLLYMSNSQTSLACLVIAITLLLVGRMPVIARNPPRIIVTACIGAITYVALDAAIDLRETILELLGRDASLTNRTYVWEVLRGLQENPIVGTGFMSFWTGERMHAAWRQIGEGINQAHNGYLEQYLNLGYVGVAFIIIIMLAALGKLLRRLRTDPPAGMMCLCFLAAAVLYNYTEASFYGINNMWLLLLVACLEVPKPGKQGSLAASVLPSKSL